MTARAPFLGVALLGAIVTACNPGPVDLRSPREPSQPTLTSSTAPFNVSGVNGIAGAKKEPISGSIGLLGGTPPARSLTTPSGRCHYWDSPTATQFSGDVSGTVTFDEQVHAPCTFSNLVGSGPLSGQVTWNGRTGTISGQWTTNCNADPLQPVGLSCDGTMNARGTGGLEGVQFHFKWGPGWYPFPYTGTAFSN